MSPVCRVSRLLRQEACCWQTVDTRQVAVIVSFLFVPTLGTTVMSEVTETSDLVNEPVAVRLNVPRNNELVRLYPDAGTEQCGIIRHDYDGLPALGTVLYDVVGYEIVDATFHDLDDDDNHMQEYEYYEREICEWIDEAVFDTSLSSADCNTYRGDTHEWRVEHPWEGDEFVIHLHTANKRRIK